MEFLTVKDIAELKNITERYVRKQIASGQLKTAQQLNPMNGQMQYVVSIDALPPDLQQKYYARLKSEAAPISAAKQKKEPRPARNFDQYSDFERDAITFWQELLEDWRRVCREFGNCTKGTDYFLLDCQRRYGDSIYISKEMLYRKYSAYRDGNIEGLLDHRGGWNKGQTQIPEIVWQAFLRYFLDDRQLSVSQCYEITRGWAEEIMPECVATLPTERTFRRRISTLPVAIVKLCRYGEKAAIDECLPYIERDYSELCANDVWIADNHTIDVIVRYDDKETTHRIYITTFMDAKSGVIVGWNITDNPCANSTIFALRMGIERFGIPRMVYFDNGTEFLTLDIAGRGHRTPKSQRDTERPPAILQRLGIEMRNAIVRNARAKPVERYFRYFKESISKLFSTYCGGNVLEKPESLKQTLKNGKIPLDSELRDVVAELIDGIHNMGKYGGPERVKYQGMSRIDVWNATIVEMRKASAEDLNLLLMRTSQYQKVQRQGVYITQYGKKLWYYDEKTTWQHIEEEVYVRFDPTNLASARIYDKDDRYLATWPLEDELRLNFVEQEREKVGNAEAKLRRIRRTVIDHARGLTADLTPEQRIDALDIRIRQAHAAKEGMLIHEPKRIMPIRANEKSASIMQAAVGQNTTGVVFDMAQMNKNAAGRRKE